jgi:regulator of sirC expression with transglutaminase-like and TPR domain
MASKLMVLAGPDEGRVFTLGSETTLLGRSRATETHLTDPHCSRVHCQIIPEGKGYTVVDFDSASGTFVNGKEIDRHTLQSGDLIRIGSTHLQYVAETAEAPAPSSAPAKPPHDWAGELVGETFSHYHITSPLARGKLGYIFHARDTRTDTAIALKVMHPDFSKDEKKVHHFVEAMKAVLPLSHPHLLKHLGAGKTGEYCWVATEYVPGESLAAVIGRVAKTGKLDWKPVLRVATSLVQALEYAHQKKLIHQNVTPQNILVGKQPKNTKLADLMLATATEEDPTKPISAAGMPSEALPYMSPERTDGAGARIDARTDLYSLAATVYAMLTGKAPLRRDDGGGAGGQYSPGLGALFRRTWHSDARAIREGAAPLPGQTPAGSLSVRRRLTQGVRGDRSIPQHSAMTLDLDTALPALALDPTAPFDLAEIALLLARDEFADVDVEAYLNEIAAMARDVRPTLRGHLAHQVQALCRYLFHEMGFRGNAREYYDPRNSYFNLVLERRLGIPITLSAVVMAIGERVGLRVVGVGLPGHFIVRAEADGDEVLIDPFHGGRILSLDDCAMLVHQATGATYAATSLALEPLPLGLIVQRMLGNLKSIYWKQTDWPRTIRVLERMRQLNPHDVVLRRDLGVCQMHCRRPGKAIDDLRAYLAAAPEADDTESIRLLLKSAMKWVAQWN